MAQPSSSLSWPPLGPAGPMPWCGSMEMPTTCPFLQRVTWVYGRGSASNVPYGKICQLKVHQLLSSGSQVVYLEGLNGCQMLVIKILPESLSNGMTMLKGESTFLQVDLSQSATKEQGPMALSLGGGISPTPATSPTRTFPPKQKAKLVWPWRSVNSYPGQFWNLLA